LTKEVDGVEEIYQAFLISYFEDNGITCDSADNYEISNSSEYVSALNMSITKDYTDSN